MKTSTAALLVVVGVCMLVVGISGLVTMEQRARQQSFAAGKKVGIVDAATVCAAIIAQ